MLLLPACWSGRALGYFLEHSLHDRVQGNWPCFLYPALAILAADAFAAHRRGWRKISMIAAPLAAVLLLAVYVQALFAPSCICARIRWRASWAAISRPSATVAAAMVEAHLADAVLTTDYETTAWLRFNQPGLKVVQVNEPQRYPDAPVAPAALLKRPLLYLAELRRDQHPLVQQSFAYTGFPTQLQTAVRASTWSIRWAGPKVPRSGKMP